MWKLCVPLLDNLFPLNDVVEHNVDAICTMSGRLPLPGIVQTLCPRVGIIHHPPLVHTLPVFMSGIYKQSPYHNAQNSLWQTWNYFPSMEVGIIDFFQFEVAWSLRLFKANFHEKKICVIYIL